MITTNALIINALKGVGIEGEWEDRLGQYQVAGLAELNNLCVELNLQDLISETRLEKVCNACGSITIGPSASYSIFEQYTPDSIKVVARKSGNRFMKLIKTNKGTIYSRTRMSLPTLCTYNQEWDDENKCMKGVIFTDGGVPCEFLVVYNKKLPHYKIDDEICLSDMTINLLEEGLKYKLAKRFKLPDVADYEADFNEYKSLVETNINSNRPMTYGDYIDGSYLDVYYDLMGGVGF